MAKFHVELSIYNDFVVEADNEEEAAAKVLALGVWESLDGADMKCQKFGRRNNGTYERRVHAVARDAVHGRVSRVPWRWDRGPVFTETAKLQP